MQCRINVALVIDHPAQQFTRGLQLLAEEADARVKVLYWKAPQEAHDAEFDRSIAWDVDLLKGYSWGVTPADRSFKRRIAWLIRDLRKVRPDVLICYGWASPIALTSIIYCLLTRTRILLYGDSTWQHPTRGRHPFLRSFALRVLMHLCTGAVSTGTFNREFYIRFGMNPRHIWEGVCPADTQSFGRSQITHSGSIPGKTQGTHIGFAGKLVARKGPDELLRAAALLPRAFDWSMTMVGDGPLMPELKALAAQLGVSDRVTFHGFANTSEMPKLLAGFDVVVVPSRLDMRVLVTIEAMAAGAAVIVSDATAVWGAGDLIEHGVTGLVYPSGSPAALARELDRLLSDQGLLAKMRSNGAERALRYGPEAFADAIMAAVRKADGDHGSHRTVYGSREGL
jgi:glycosyltransferase involved in cell wall biosynthesis